MLKIGDIKTPTTILEFRDNLKKYCLGNRDSIFIYNRKIEKQHSININKISKISDVFKYIIDDCVLDVPAREYDIVLMCDISHVNVENIISKDKETVDKLKEVYLFNNQDNHERSNFLNSTPIAIEKIVSGGKIVKEIDTKPRRTSMDYQMLRGLYVHLFGEYFDTVISKKKNI